MERTVIYTNTTGEEIEVGLLELFTPDYLARRGDLVGIEQEARAMLGDDFVSFGWRKVEEAQE